MRACLLCGTVSWLAGCGVLLTRAELNHDEPTAPTEDSTAPTEDSTAPTPQPTAGDTGAAGQICPEPGKAAIVATITAYPGAPLVAEDLVSVAALDGFLLSGVAVVSGDQIQSLPYDLVGVDFEPGTVNLTPCIDRVPFSELCAGPEDTSIFDLFGAYALLADTVHTYTIDFTAGTFSETGAAPKDAACP